MQKLKGKQTFDLPYGVHRFNYIAPFPILVSHNDEPVGIIGGGKGKTIWRGEGTISLDPTDKDAYGFNITTKVTTPKEAQDHEAPPEPAPADNYLAMMREKVRQQMGIIRENFAERPSIYEMGNIDVFEEDQPPSGQQSGQGEDAPSPQTPTPDPEIQTSEPPETGQNS